MILELLRRIFCKQEVTKMKLIKNYIPEGARCSTHHGFDNGQASIITIHWTGPLPNQTPEQVRNYWISNGEASAHFIIKDEVCLQCWPTDTVAWHAGCRAGNYTSLGIEVIPKNEAGEFSDKSITTLKELIATLPKMPIVRHYDWTSKDCPRYYCDVNKWQELLAKISK